MVEPRKIPKGAPVTVPGAKAAPPAGDAGPDPGPAPATERGPFAARLCQPHERAVKNPDTGALVLRRYRVRAVSVGAALRPTGQYILAPTRKSAEELYLQVEDSELRAAGFFAVARNGSGEVILDDGGKPALAKPFLVVDELAD